MKVWRVRSAWGARHLRSCRSAGNAARPATDWHWKAEGHCVTCGRPVIDTQGPNVRQVKAEYGEPVPWRFTPPVVACGEQCRRAEHQHRWNSKVRVEHQERACACCWEPFTPKRADAAYCSAACRQAAYRQRKAVTR